MAFAEPLPVGKQPQRAEMLSRSRRKRVNGDNDTPKAFARLMQLQAGTKQRNGLDNGEDRKTKKRKLKHDSIRSPTARDDAEDASAVPKILPGERLADFAARVDQALPVSGLTRKGKSEGERQTRTEKRLQKMYAEWHREEARRKEKEEELREAAEEADEDGQDVFEPRAGGRDRNQATGKKQKKGKRRRVIGEIGEAEDDPWAALNARGDRPKSLHDVAQAPPQFSSVPREKFKMKDGAKIEVSSVPNAAGSLKRREELRETREDVIRRYRQMMGERRGKAT